MSLGKVIVWTNAYNAEKTLARAMDSILNQTYQDWIYLVLDNGSTDDTRYIITDYAARDSRIVALAREHNEINCGSYIEAVWQTTAARWYCHLDADDEYDVTFLEKMVVFVAENRLDIAAAGYEKIDGTTGGMIKRRSAGENYILEGRGFADKFIQYRGFTLFLWAKLYSIEFLVSTGRSQRWKEWNHFAQDSRFVLCQCFGNAERAGIFGESLYKYYQYPKHYNAMEIEGWLISFKQLYFATRDYLFKFGGLSKENKDFLQAILMSIIDDNVQIIKRSNFGLGKKLHFLLSIFSDPDTQTMFRYQADPKFRNLAARTEYKREIISWIEAQESVMQYKATVDRIKHSLEGAG